MLDVSAGSSVERVLRVGSFAWNVIQSCRWRSPSRRCSNMILQRLGFAVCSNVEGLVERKSNCHRLRNLYFPDWFFIDEQGAVAPLPIPPMFLMRIM